MTNIYVNTLSHNIEYDKIYNKYSLLLNSEIYTEASANPQSKIQSLLNIFNGYMDDMKQLSHLYNERKSLKRDIQLLKLLCKLNPEVAKTKIHIRGYNKKVVSQSNTPNEQYQILVNLLANAKLAILNNDVSILYTNYQYRKNGWDTFYEIPIGSVLYAQDEALDILDHEIDTVKASMNDLSSYANSSTIKNPGGIVETFNNTLNFFKDFIRKKVEIHDMEVEAFKYEVGRVLGLINTKNHKKYVKEPPLKDIIKYSELVDTIKYGDTEYPIYKTKYENISALNYGGHAIYVDNSFFDLPKGYQLGILYHEIGHHQCGHFGIDAFNNAKPSQRKKINIPVEDERQLIKRVKDDYNKFLFYSSIGSFSFSENYLNGEEFLYLLLEWEADRFAANQVGKKLVRNAITNTMRSLLDGTKTDRINYAFNMDRTRVRNSVM